MARGRGIWQGYDPLIKPSKIDARGLARSGLPRPLTGLPVGAYYQDPVNVPIGIGSYEQQLGADMQQAPLPDQTLLGIIQSLSPLGPVTPWAELDGSSAWKEIATTDRLLYRMTQSQLDIAQKTSGDLPSVIGIYSGTLIDAPQIKSAFDDSGYDWIKTEGVYEQSDLARVPQIRFLHWGMQSPGAKHSVNEAQLAQMLNGQLVYPVTMPPAGSNRGRPTGSFRDAMRVEFDAASSLQEPLVLADKTPESASVGKALSLGALFFGLSCAAGAGYVGYKLIMRSRS